MSVTYEDLKTCYDELSSRYGGQKTDYFALAYIMQEFGLEREQALQQVNLSGDALGIDAFHIDRERGNLYLLQCRWAQNHHVFETPFQRLINHGLERIFTDASGEGKQSQFVLHLKRSLLENQALIGRVFVHFVFNGNTGEAEKSVVLENFREELEAKKFIIDQFFAEKPATFSFQFFSNQARSLSNISHTRETHQYEINLSQTSAITTANGEVMHLGLVSLMDLYRIYKEMDYRFFERNIRAGLSADKPPNKEIRKSLKNMVIEDAESPDSFAFNHNGVTISAERFEILAGRAMITEPRLLNGAQTVTSLAEFIKKNEKAPKFKSNKNKLEKIQVVCKIISKAPNEFVTHVTICNNRQNPVEAWNLRSNDLIQLQLQDKFREDLGIYYERQEKAFDELTEGALEELGIQETKKLEVKRLAQTFLAMQGEIDRMSRLREVFGNQSVYDNTFRESYLKKDSRSIIFCYKIQFRLGRIIKEFELDNAEKFYFIRGGKNVLWGLMIQAFLNEMEEKDWEDLVERHGKNLTVEAVFTEELASMAIKKLKPVLLKAAKEAPYAGLIEEEKYTFVRNKKFFTTCMTEAGIMYGWEKKKI